MKRMVLALWSEGTVYHGGNIMVGTSSGCGGRDLLMAYSYLGRSGSRKMHANTQLPFSLFPSYLVWDHRMVLHAFTCLPPSFNHLWKRTQTCSKVFSTKVFPTPVH